MAIIYNIKASLSIFKVVVINFFILKSFNYLIISKTFVTIYIF